MRVRRVAIENFRGIKHLTEWPLSSRLVCLIGQGDTCKSSLLDAIGYALSPTWSLPIGDGDFHNCDVSTPITIDVTLGDIPPELRREDKYGLWLRGIGPDGSLHDEPEDDDDVVLTIRLLIDDSLEPNWSLVKDAMGDQSVRVTSRDRGNFGVFQVDEASPSHLRWSPGSALTRLGGDKEIGAMVTRAHREARKTVFDHPLETLKKGAALAGEALRRIGGANLHDPRPGLDPSRMGRGTTLVLHDGVVPASQLGLGSQRLASLAFQLEALESQSVVLIDEIELGLEPHRLLHLLEVLRKRADEKRGQVLLTTHSPLVIEAVHARELHVVRADAGQVTVMQVPEAIGDMKRNEPQATVRSGPSAMLARRVVVCEGKTEVGLGRAITRAWDTSSDAPLALAGVVFRHGGGNEAPVKARVLAELGYETALLHDDDLTKKNKAEFDASAEAAITAGARRFVWEPGCALEDQIARSLPPEALKEVVEAAATLTDSDDPERAIGDAVANRLGGSPSLSGLDPVQWAVQSGRSDSDVRDALGRVAHAKNWFKNETAGERLGEIVVSHLSSVPETDRLAQTLSGLRAFASGEATPGARSGTDGGR